MLFDIYYRLRKQFQEKNTAIMRLVEILERMKIINLLI